MDKAPREAPSLFLDDGALRQWAARKNLDAETRALYMYMHWAQGMLDIAGRMEIDNPPLQVLLESLRQLVYDGNAVLNELNYFRELDGTKHAADALPKGCIHHLHSQARHTARALAAKLKPSSSSCVTVYGEADEIDDKLTSIGMSSASGVGNELQAQAVQTPKPKFNRLLLCTKMADIVEELKTFDMVSRLLDLELRYRQPKMKGIGGHIN